MKDGFVWLAAFVNVFVFGILLENRLAKQPPDETERVYQISYGRTVCAKMERTACGIRLSNCTDARVYECMTNVFFEDDE